jgi:hypothetical protein
MPTYPTSATDPEDELPRALLPGVPVDEVLERYRRAAGDEIGRGKFTSRQSSAALAANTFGYFMQRHGDLPPFPRWVAAWSPRRVVPEGTGQRKPIARFKCRANLHLPDRCNRRKGQHNDYVLLSLVGSIRAWSASVFARRACVSDRGCSEAGDCHMRRTPSHFYVSLALATFHRLGPRHRPGMGRVDTGELNVI